MDSRNLPTQSSSYVGLLNSQQGSVLHENFPYESSQTSSTNVSDHEIRPEGVKAAKSKMNTAKEKSLAEYTSIWEMKKEDLAMKERLSKLAILDTLLAKKEPLMLILIQESQIVDARPLKYLGISSIPKKTGDRGLNISSKLETEDHSLDAFRPTKPGNSPGIGH
ncbi:hypothetical protein F2Q68_00020327 [Brassica cretica]|uniref:No apical meristem-associated C-terminal domain-containing protein n=1 Tax=Brassica cretica TaxID=69181 RepID=A0A8S9G791_BRACR|nr:hypothetical protein F2Q68_00020327 [Brassica cretica]